MTTIQPHSMSSDRDFEEWLEHNGLSHGEIWVEIFKKGSGKQTVTFAELLDAALCYGWIDVKKKGIDEDRYAIRFVPRRPNSSWSDINSRSVRRLIDAGRMTPAGAASLPDEIDFD